MRDWLVAGAILEQDGQILLVRNRRRNGSHDWTTPGGVIDSGESLLEGLTREVAEETGLAVAAWDRLAYRVEVEFLDRGWILKVETHVAQSWTGEVALDDPDGIVDAADYIPTPRVSAQLVGTPRWVAEPLTGWMTDRDDGVVYRYRVANVDDGGIEVERC